MKANDLPAMIMIIDFRKAFDTIHRGKMLKSLPASGILKQIVDAIGKMYETTKERVVSPNGETDLFEILAGVLQGDALTPYQFVIIPRNLKGGVGSLLTPVLTLWVGGHITRHVWRWIIVPSD